MNTQVETRRREAILVEDAASIRVMGFPVLEALPSRSLPYEQVDPFILLHEARLLLSDLANVDTRYPHRGLDNLWYLLMAGRMERLRGSMDHTWISSIAYSTFGPALRRGR